MSQEIVSTYSPAYIVQQTADEMIWSSIAFLLAYVMRVLPVMSTDDDSHHTHRQIRSSRHAMQGDRPASYTSKKAEEYTSHSANLHDRPTLG